MRKRFTVMALAVFAFAVTSVSVSNAGTDMIIDNSAQAPPPPAYNYAPPPPRIYYAPPAPVAVVVTPGYRCFAPGVRVYPYHSRYARRVYRPVHRWY